MLPFLKTEIGICQLQAPGNQRNGTKIYSPAVFFFQIQFWWEKVYPDPHQTPDGHHRRLYHPQQPLARQEGQAPRQEGHGPRHLGRGAPALSLGRSGEHTVRDEEIRGGLYPARWKTSLSLLLVH